MSFAARCPVFASLPPPSCDSSNQLGQLTAEGINSPGFFPDQNGSAISTTGVPVAGGKQFVELAAGGYHTCGRTALDSGGETFCFGANDQFQSGNSFTSSRAAMLPVKVSSHRWHSDHSLGSCSCSWLACVLHMPATASYLDLPVSSNFTGRLIMEIASLCS